MSASKRDIASLRKEATNTGKTQQTEVNDACPLREGRAKTSRPSIWEVLLNAVCAGVLLPILVPAFYVSEEWLERVSQRALDHMIWREPIESWNR